MLLQRLQKICLGIWETPSNIFKFLFLSLLLLLDTVTGYPYKRCLLKGVVFLVGFYKYFHISDKGLSFIYVERVVHENKVVFNRDAFNDFIREKHNDGTTPLRDLVEKHYGNKAVTFIERYI